MDKELWYLFLPDISKEDVDDIKSQTFKNIKDIGLSQENQKILTKFNAKTFIPKIEIEVNIKDEKVKFEYNISNNIAKNFEYFL